MKKIILSLVAVMSLPAMACVDRDTRGYIVREGNKITRVNTWDMDKSLASVEPRMTPELFKAAVVAGCKIKAAKMSDGSYYLREKSGLDGKGPILAFVGAGVVGVVGIVGTVATAAFFRQPAARMGIVAAGGTGTKAAVAGTFGFLAALPTP